jgi:hypothetical protein
MRRLAVILGLALLVTGCGGGSHESSNTQTAAGPSSTTTVAATATAKVQSDRPKRTNRATAQAAVRAALAENHRLVTRALWTNHVPPTAQRSTRGPALAALIASANDRTKKRIRVRMLRDDYQVLSVQLAPKEAQATAVAEWNQRVQPSHLDGRPLGRAVALHERARIQLRRATPQVTFVVWKVTLVK